MSQCYEDEPLLLKRNDGLKTDVLNPIGDLSFPGATLILFCTAVGAGVVAIPKAFSFSGWLAGMLALSLSGALSTLSLTCLFECAKIERSPATYQSLVQKYLPRGPSSFVDISMVLLLLGAIGTMLLLAMHVWQSVELATGIAPLSPSQIPWVLLVAEWLLCLPRNFTELQGVTLGNLCACLGCILIICFESAKMTTKGEVHSLHVTHSAPGFSAVTSLTGLLSALPIALYGFFCQIQAPQLYAEMKPSSRHQAFLTGAAASAACFFVYACVGFLGYSAFGSNVESDILRQLTKADSHNPWLCLAQLLFGLVLLLSTPLVLAPLRNMALRSFAKDAGNFNEARDTSIAVHVVATFSILALAMVIALSVPGVDFIMGILGATCVVFLALIVPGLLTLNCCTVDWKLSGWTLVIAGSILAPLTFGAFMAKELGYLPR